MWESSENYPQKPAYSQVHSKKMTYWQENVREYADKHEIPFRKALTWAEPYDLQDTKDHLKSLPEYDVVELDTGGIIGVERK